MSLEKNELQGHGKGRNDSRRGKPTQGSETIETRTKKKNVLLRCGSENGGKKRDLSSPVIKMLISGQN